MKWVKLKDHLVASFMRQIDKVCEIYLSNKFYLTNKLNL